MNQRDRKCEKYMKDKRGEKIGSKQRAREREREREREKIYLIILGAA